MLETLEPRTLLAPYLIGSSGNVITGFEGSATVTAQIGTFYVAYTPGGHGGQFVNPQATVNWGDGTPTVPAEIVEAGSEPYETGTIVAAHTYADEGTYAYVATVTDPDSGGECFVSGTAIIADAPLNDTNLVQPRVACDEASIFPVPVSGAPGAGVPAQGFGPGPVVYFNDTNPISTTDPMSTIGDFKATIDWGDGTPLTAGTINVVGGGEFEVDGSHIYADAGVNGGTGTYSIQVFIADTGGSTLAVDNTAYVTDNPINLTGHLNPESDSGLSTGNPGVTNVNQPDFLGTSEPFSTVTLSAEDLLVHVTYPLGHVQAGSDGDWNLKSDVLLPNGTYGALPDGAYAILASAVDQFDETRTGEVFITPSPLVIDTHTLVIDDVAFDRLHGEVHYVIQVPALADGSAPAGVLVSTLLDSSNYLFTTAQANKAYPGKWVVTNVTETSDRTIPYAYDVTVQFNYGAVIHGGSYLFTIRGASNGDSSVQDKAGNHLDGVFYGSFPSGNGINGSDFVAELVAYHNIVKPPRTIIGAINPDPPAATAHTAKKVNGHVVVKTKSGGSLLSTSRAKPKALVVSDNHPKGPVPLS